MLATWSREIVDQRQADFQLWFQQPFIRLSSEIRKFLELDVHLLDKKKKIKGISFLTAMYSYFAKDEGELSVQKGDELFIIEKDDRIGYYFGCLKENTELYGYFPIIELDEGLLSIYEYLMDISLAREYEFMEDCFSNMGRSSRSPCVRVSLGSNDRTFVKKTSWKSESPVKKQSSDSPSKPLPVPPLREKSKEKAEGNNNSWSAKITKIPSPRGSIEVSPSTSPVKNVEAKPVQPTGFANGWKMGNLMGNAVGLSQKDLVKPVFTKEPVAKSPIDVSPVKPEIKSPIVNSPKAPINIETKIDRVPQRSPSIGKVGSLKSLYEKEKTTSPTLSSPTSEKKFQVKTPSPKPDLGKKFGNKPEQLTTPKWMIDLQNKKK